MNLLCPSCQKMLTVPEANAGQLMQCPLCSGKFTVPALPPGSDPDVPAPPPPPPPLPEADPHMAFSLEEPAAPPEPAFVAAPLPRKEPKSTPQPAAPTKPAATPTTLEPGGYTRICHLAANVQVLQWVPLAAAALIFVLTFLPWVGVYPGGVAAVTQNAWQSAFGSYSHDPDTDDLFKVDEKNEPGVSLLLLFYLLPFLLLTLLVAGYIAAEPRLAGAKIPPQLQQLLPWKWAILAGLNVVLFLFLTLQMLLSFGIERSVTTAVDNDPNLKVETSHKSPEKKVKEAKRGVKLAELYRTRWLTITFWLQAIATAAALLVYWVERRGPGKPLPALELRW